MAQNRTSSGLRLMGAPTSILDAVSVADVCSLQKTADEISRKFFKNTVQIKVRWGIPSASEPGEPETDIASLSKPDRERLMRAVIHFNGHRYQQALEELKPLVENGQRESSQLYLKTLIKLDDPSWPEVARKINRLYTGTLYVAPGSTEQREDEEPCILIHPTLSSSAGESAPKYVIGYVIFHEMLHKWWDTTPEDQHPPLFRRMDKTFPDRKKAIRWLQENNFTTIEDSIL
jgi:hypothetical protein